MVDIKKYFEIGDYTIKDGLISTNDDVELINLVKKLPVQFGQIGGSFYCHDNQLTSLEGSPKTVGYFDCCNNQLISLVGGPNIVVSSFLCRYNKLTSLVGGPKSVGDDFNCGNNKLSSLEGSPKEVGGSFYLTWTEDLPLLRLVRYKKIETYNSRVNAIINKYCNHKPSKEAILLCQKELIDNGFVGNASW